MGVTAALLFPGQWEMSAVAVGCAIALMSIFRVTHPPAGAVPLVALGAPLQSASLFGTILIGCCSLIGLAVMHHRLPPRAHYPRRPEPGSAPVPENDLKAGERV
jgi:CBS-domain-containing membrane protein